MSDGKKNPAAPLDSGFFEILAQEAIMGIMAFELSSSRCIYSNNLAREILDFPVDTSPDQPPDLILTDLFVPAARGHLRPLSEEILRREGLTQDVLVKKRSGTTFIANVGVRYVRRNDTDEVLLLMFQDITFQKKLQRELTIKQEEIHKAYCDLLEQNRQLRELDLAKDKFVALMTHELRTPLAAIVATSEVIQLKLYDTPEQLEEFSKSIHEQGMHLMELVNDVLDFAKIRAGKMDYYIEQKDIRPLLSQLFENFRLMADQASVEMSIELPETELLCWFDRVRMKEVINNVLSNAIKYNRKEGGRVRVTAAPLENYIRITVADTGQGIAPNKVASVFNEFETVGSVSRHHKGTGLGMPISKRLAEGIGGRLLLSSEIGVGSEFYIDIPVNKVLAEEFYRSRPDDWGDLAA
ncbi:MAG: HAMP domain-containing histidine kinase [Bdellovibrionaceae bacterium]|nr:HAMP domain-containing histidine kinase [Pseudobdellovibrionaceae bacterium]